MKAVVCTRYGAPEVLKLQQVAMPEPGPGEIRVKVMTTTVTVADFRVRSMTVPKPFGLVMRFVLGFRKPRNPILGMEIAGVVDQVGAQVTRFKVGDKVMGPTLKGFGGYAAYRVFKSTDPLVHLPTNYSLRQRAAFPVGARTALHYLQKVELKKGEHILVYGASGSVGTYTVQLAKHLGAEVTAVCSGKNAEWVKALGADRVLDYTAPRFEEQLRTYDVLFIAVDQWPEAACLPYLKKGGRYTNITRMFIAPRWAWKARKAGQKMVLAGSPPETVAVMEEVKALAEKGVFRPVLDCDYPLEDIRKAHHHVDQGHKKGNVTITVHPETLL
ncbi:MAG: NAD(P)-dependent alcohol dehydrogenase [Salibacteraceae bacterium]